MGDRGTINDLPDIHYDNLANIETSYWWHVARLNWVEWIIKKYFPDPAALNIIDYGCGTGGFLHELNKRLWFKSCFGVDTSPHALQYARKYGNNYALIEPGDVGLAGDKDLILLMDVLEHIEDDEVFIRNLIDGMKPDAYVLIMVPAFPCLYSEWDRVLKHHRRYTKKDIERLLDKAGGEVIYMGYFFSYLFLPIFLKRILMRKRYGDDNCEFPPVSALLNRILLFCSRLEMLITRWVKCSAGSTLVCLIKKNLSSPVL